MFMLPFALIPAAEHFVTRQRNVNLDKADEKKEAVWLVKVLEWEFSNSNEISCSNVLEKRIKQRRSEHCFSSLTEGTNWREMLQIACRDYSNKDEFLFPLNGLNSM